MEELFSNNLFAIYIIASIAVISYTNFNENQRMFLLYLFTFATAFFEIFEVTASIILLVLITFVFLEYLTEDIKKLTLITNLLYKLYDYLFMMFFQYHFFLDTNLLCDFRCFTAKLFARLSLSCKSLLYFTSLHRYSFINFPAFQD